MEIVDESVSVFVLWLLIFVFKKQKTKQKKPHQTSPDLETIWTYVFCFKLNIYIFPQGEIRVTGFNQEVDKFYSLIETGKVRCSFR